MSEFKPCPFCGGPASYYEKGSLFAAIHCRKCGFGRRLEISDGTIRDIHPSLCECWNNRAESIELATLREQLSDYEESARSRDALVRKLDVIWNGEAGAAKQASLCDIVCQLEAEVPTMREQVKVLRTILDEMEAKL